jgi:K+-sensing histidine kinase KdpD
VTTGRAGSTRESQGLEKLRDANHERDEPAEFMRQASALLASSLNFENTLTSIADLVVSAIADLCVFELLEEGQLRRVAVVHRDPEKAALAQELQERVPASLLERQTGRLRSDEPAPQLFRYVTNKLIDRVIEDGAFGQIIKNFGVSSAATVPLAARGRTIGQITVAFDDSGRHYARSDIHILQELAHRVGIAIENARLYRDAQLARAELIRANHAKDEFLGIVSHELRTPLTTILGSARLLSRRKGRLSETEKAKLTENIEAEAERMAKLVEDLLLLARLDVQQELTKDVVELAPLVEKLSASLKATRSLLVHGEVAGRTVLAEPLFLEQILRNLVENADKYGAGNEPIELTFEDAEAEVQFRVLDRGPGVEPDELPLLFDSFYRSANTSHLPGKGLGLAICRRLVEVQGGAIWARLRTGGGLEVGFSLPTQREASQP